MKPRVLAIGLDSFGFPLLQKWLGEGRLPHLGNLRRRGSLGVVRGAASYAGEPVSFKATEPLWTIFQTGVLPDQTGYWSCIRYDPLRYEATADPKLDGYDYAAHKPFYALGADFPIVAFDVPVSRLSAEVEGIQVLGWGGHAPFVPSESRPAGLLGEIIKKHGRDELLHKDSGEFWNDRYQRWFVPTAKDTSRKRSAICRDLMREHPWSLFLTAFGETHSAAHDLWFRSATAQALHPTPATAPLAGRLGSADPLLDVYQSVDRAIGEIVAQAPQDSYVLCFSLHGMGANSTDLASMVLLPEFLYRWNFPGRVGLGPGTNDRPMTANVRDFWGAEVWRRRWEARLLRRAMKRILPAWAVGKGRGCELESPYEVRCDPPNLGWMPAAWYRRLWPRMKAFALPAFTDGQVRINLVGRDGDGIVSAEDYDCVCGEVTAALQRLCNGRTGAPAVKQVYRTRRSAREDDSKLSAADLIVVWRDEPVDVFESPDVGRIGPLPYYRTGGHHPKGFLLACGPGIPSGGVLPDGETTDLAPTILRLMNAPIPGHFIGQPLVHFSESMRGLRTAGCIT